jgi:hypothetical protein
LKLSTTGSALTTQIRGIDVLAGSANVLNNMIRVGIDADGYSITGGYFIQGISLQTAGITNTYFNSVYVGGSGVTGAQATSAIRKSNAAGTHDIKNNILVNARSNAAGIGVHYGILLNGVTSVTSNYNILHVTGTGGAFGSANNGTTTRATLSAWQTATGLDGNSSYGSPNYIAPTGTSATVDLHVQSPTPIESAGFNIATVTTDYDGQTRSGLTPVDIGADAGDFTGADIFPPSLIHNVVTKTASTSNVTISATITDATGVPTSGVLQPRIWFRRSSAPSAWASTQGVLQSGSATNGIWNFTVDYSLLSFVPVLGETYQYYFAAQDIVATPNIGTTPGGGVHPDVNTQTSAPPTPNSYSIVVSFSGTYTVGSSDPTYNSLTGATGSPGGFFAAINAGIVTGNITVNIASDLSELGTNGLSQWVEEGVGGYNVTIQPSDATVKNIIGNVLLGADQPSGATVKNKTGNVLAPQGNAMIRLDGCDKLTIDGRFAGSGKYLMFRNTSTTTATVSLQNDASNNTIRNCIIEGSNTTATEGVVFITPGVTTFITGNDNNLITENQIRDRSDLAGVPANLIYSVGFGPNVRNSGNVISNNELFNFINTGIFLAPTNSSNENFTVTGNTIYQTAARTTQLCGMQLNTLGTNNVISQNIIRDLNTSWFTFGIVVDDIGTANITRNRIYSFLSTSGSTSAMNGIYLNGSTNGVANISNNQISIIPSFTNTQNIYGIADYGNPGDIANIYYNSVYIGGTGTLAGKSYAWHKNSSTSTDVLRNNLFINARIGGTGGNFSAGKGISSFNDQDADNNFFAGNGPTVGNNFEVSGVAVSFATYKTYLPAGGKDANSWSINSTDLTVNNLFVDVVTGNLNINTGNVEAWLVAGKGAAIARAGITDIDYSGTVRNTLVSNGTTCIGSHEFSLAGLLAPPDATVSGSPVVSQSQTITLNGKTIGTITWTGGTALPTAISARYYSGRQNPNPTTGTGSFAYWVITPTGGTDYTYDLTLNYDPSSLGAITESTTKLAKWSGTEWVYFAGSTVNMTAKTVKMTGLTSFSDFALTTSDNPLPVELANFSVKAKSRNANLTWETKTEVDNSGFEVQRKDIKGEWTKLAFVEGNGTSNSPKYYSFEDKKLTSGKFTYRLKQIDNNGSTDFSDEIEIFIDLPTEFALSQNYPNPFNPSTKIDYQLATDSRVNIELYSITGERVVILMSEEQQAGYYSMMVDAFKHQLASGIYIYRMIATDAAGKNFIATKKLVLIK